MNRREERMRALTICLVCAVSAAIVWVIFHGVYLDLTASAKAVGYVDSLATIGIGLGYVVMVGGTLVLAAIALWAGINYLRLLRDR
jgi:hypothetical protein